MAFIVNLKSKDVPVSEASVDETVSSHGVNRLLEHDVVHWKFSEDDITLL